MFMEKELTLSNEYIVGMYFPSSLAISLTFGSPSSTIFKLVDLLSPIVLLLYPAVVGVPPM